VTQRVKRAAYGGPGFKPRTQSLREELGTIWADCGVNSEWSRLKSILLHRPGPELARSAKPDQVLMLEPLEPGLACRQHDALKQAYEKAGVQVYSVIPPGYERSRPPPNLMFVADLMFMTPEGAIIGRPASTVRAGEEKHITRRLADIGIPILKSVHGTGTFECADAAWLNPQTVLLSHGLRTNPEGAAQVASVLSEIGIETIVVDLVKGTMHQMGQLRFLDDQLAVVWPERVSLDTIEALEAHASRVLIMPDKDELETGLALNFTTLGPRRILMPAGNPNSQAFLERHGIEISCVNISELTKAAGGIACLTGVLSRE